MANQGWHRVTKSRPCGVCGKPDWCTYTDDGIMCCMRIASDAPMVNDGYRHIQRGATPEPPEYRPPPPARYYDDQSIEWERQSGVHDLAARLGLTVNALRAYHVGWDGRAWTFPMRDRTFGIIGFRRRFPDGRKLSMKGGKEGLFVPVPSRVDDRLVICEGPTDAAALWEIGCHVVGRPSNVGGYDLLCGLLRMWRPRRLIVVADRDRVGSDGELNTKRGARRLLAFAESERIEAGMVRPPLKVKDARDWIREGATLRDIVGG